MVGNMKYGLGIVLSLIVSFIANLIMIKYGIDIDSRCFVSGVIGFVITGIVLVIGGEK